MQITLERLRELIDTLRTGQVGEFEYEDENLRLRFVLGGSAVARTVTNTTAAAPEVPPPAAAVAVPKVEAVKDENVVFVSSPFVGTFYSSPAPDAAPFVNVGSRITVGQTLCIVEAMKLMNEIEADVAGTIVEVLIENGVSVEFGQKLFKVKKA
jgi:acetyl-CoA carboxylase biotin carboxyl carrier protein